MSLIICPECGKQVSDKAAICPSCNYPIQVLFDINKYEIASNYEVKKCSHCGRDIPKRIAKCPYCGRNQNTIWGIIGTVILIYTFLRIILYL